MLANTNFRKKKIWNCFHDTKSSCYPFFTIEPKYDQESNLTSIVHKYFPSKWHFIPNDPERENPKIYKFILVDTSSIILTQMPIPNDPSKSFIQSAPLNDSSSLPHNLILRLGTAELSSWTSCFTGKSTSIGFGEKASTAPCQCKTHTQSNIFCVFRYKLTSYMPIW